MSQLDCQPEWMSWFSRLDSEDAIRRAAYMAVNPIDDFHTMGIEEACRNLDLRWKEVFVPSPQHIAILRSLVEQAADIARSQYPTLRAYNRYRSEGMQPSSSFQQIHCLTGLAGVSKSSLMKAFERICGLGNGGILIAEGQRLNLQPVRRIAIDGQQSIRNVLKGISNPIAAAGKQMSNTAILMAHVRDWLSATATCLLVVDEMQFFTQSSTANTKSSQLIMTLATLGVPVIFVANYSLVNKLLQRPQEEKDRLLSAPIVLNPPTADDDWWTECVVEYSKVAPGRFLVTAPADVEEIHRLTGGLCRALREILLQAYKEASERGGATVTMHEVRLAYSSRTYSARRKDIEDLASLSISPVMGAQRPDLVCAFTERPIRTHRPQPDKTAKGTIAVQPIDVSAALLESTISADARNTLRVLRKSSVNALDDQSAKVVPMPKRTPVSAESLLDGARLLRQSMDKSDPAKGKAPSVLDKLRRSHEDTD